MSTSPFVQVPVSVLEADMPDSHKIGFERLIYQCFRERSDSIRGTHRGIAKMLHVAKSSFMRMVPAWVKAGWIMLESVGKELVLTLRREQLQSVPNRDTPQQTPLPPVPDKDGTVPTWDENGPDRGKSVPVLSLIPPVISNITLENNNNNSITSIIFHNDAVPELTPGLVLELISPMLPIPKRPTGGAALELWVQKWANPAQKILARLAPMTGPLAWREIDEVIRFMLWEGSGWRQIGCNLSSLENVEKNWDKQVRQIADWHWQPTERTPYPGVPLRDTNEEPLPVLAERARPFTRESELVQFGSALQASHPLELSIRDLPDGSMLLLAQFGPDHYFGIDPEVWDNPNPDELDRIYQAIAYGSACARNEQQTAAVAI